MYFLFFFIACMQESDAVALELEELRREQAGYEQQIQAVDEAMKAIQEQIDSMACTVSQNKVCALQYFVCVSVYKNNIVMATIRLFTY